MGSIKQMPTGSPVTDISLSTFLKRTWPETANELIQSASRLSGVLIFNCVGLQGGRINYNANGPQQLSHIEIAGLEKVFAPVRGWENLNPWPASTS